MKILVINAGSSSLKYQLIDMTNESVVAKGLVERIGISGSQISYEYYTKGEKTKLSEEFECPDHEVAFKKVSDFLTDSKVGVIANTSEISVIGHRVVHGGEKFASTQKITPELMNILKELTPLAPLHNPANITGINAASKIFPKAQNYAIFDTAFHQTMPAKAFRYAVPNELYEKFGVRVYGFHGTSHKYVDHRVRQYFKNPSMKNIVLHLGNGASMAAVNEKGQSIDTSMGFGPNTGIAMGTRCGDIDSAVVFFLNKQGYSVQEIDDIFNKKSGMQGLTGFSDSRDVTALYHKKDPKGMLCMDLYAYRIQKYIGAYAVALRGLDSIIFTAGVGENSVEIRELICKDMEFLGIKLDPKKNVELNHPSDVVELQASDSKVKILAVATNEELQIAREILELEK